MRFTLSFIILAIYTMTAYAGPKLKHVKGTVIGTGTETLAGAKIEVKGTDIVVYSDLDGEFTIDKLKPGTYDLTITLISYRELELEKMQLTAESSDNLVFRLHSR